jgi:hypothetical protein
MFQRGVPEPGFRGLKTMGFAAGYVLVYHGARAAGQALAG